MSALTESVASHIDVQHADRDEGFLLFLWSDEPLSDLQFAMLMRGVGGRLGPHHLRGPVPEHKTLKHLYICYLKWDRQDPQLQYKCQQLVRSVLNAHN